MLVYFRRFTLSSAGEVVVNSRKPTFVSKDFSMLFS